MLLLPLAVMLQRLFIKTPWWARLLFSSYVWRMPSDRKVVYLTFDDGPTPVVTPWVLEQLKQYNANATFFCIGANVVDFPEIYQQIIDEGHTIGNHTFQHFNGWKTSTAKYLEDTTKAAEVIETNLFRPPYGKIKNEQAKGLPTAMKTERVKVIMWDVLSADYDTTISPQQCYANVSKHVVPGSIIVFHDSEKAFPNLEFTLPKVLSDLANEGYAFEKISMNVL